MENHDSHKKGGSIKERILARIESDEITMHSKHFLSWKMVAFVIVAGLALIISVLLFNFIFFFIRINQYGEYLHHGPHGVLSFLAFFPWLLLLADIVLIVIAERLLLEFQFAYKRPVFYTLFALLALTISLGLFIDRVTQFNDSMYDRARHGHLPPPVGEFYRHMHHF